MADTVDKELREVVERFRDENRISSAETVHQCDWVIENAYEFITELMDLVGYYKHPEDEE